MKYANIGGQAVMEGVMMRRKDRYAVAVRKENHEIEVKSDTHISYCLLYTSQERGLIYRYHGFIYKGL